MRKISPPPSPPSPADPIWWTCLGFGAPGPDLAGSVAILRWGICLVMVFRWWRVQEGEEGLLDGDPGEEEVAEPPGR